MSNVNNTQNIISFCSGYGGIELGLRLAGLNARTVCYVEIEAFAQANLVAKIEEGKMDAAPIWTDLKTFPAKQFSGRVHGIIGGYPCQPFSVAGKQLGDKDPRHLWPFIREHIRAIRPLWCFFENVRGHVNNGLREVKSDLEELGYSVDAGIFSAEEVGASHRRERLFILANTRLQRQKEQEQQTAGVEQQGEELAHATRSYESERSNEGQEEGEHRGCSCGMYPARPGEPQHEWEAPRTIKSSVGRAANGTSDRVDRLRLLGNGVVPQTAAKAWRILNNE